MLKSHERFHSSNGKRLILVADDEFINREILGEILKDDYQILFAETGTQAMDMIREYSDTLSMVLLDILMPGISGLDILKAVREDDRLSKIPIIVTTSERKTEVESLGLGAIDFIPKPYPDPDIIKARILRTIELSEDRDIILSTERDELTGLYNREYFYRYAEQFDQHHKDLEMDAIIVDVNHFHMINERYGKAYGDEVLRRIGQEVREMVADSGGIVCRRQADTFMVYCPHRDDYPEIMEKASISLKDDESDSRVRLRMGVYSNVDRSIDIERRFDRAKMAADTVKGSFTRTIGFYDSGLHERELYAEQLIEDFDAALEENQFKVYYQPKFDVRPDVPVLTSAEALVRWMHPKLGMINPGIFIPLFEDNGLIERLDTYVWKETARQMRDWKDRLGYYVPISVNVSRIDLYNPALGDNLQKILSDQRLSEKDMYLEVTESAYAEDSAQIVESVEGLQKLGFQIEMDDFGVGYSSLNMISDLPIDALKLDMQFVRNAFREGGNTHLLEVIIGIADYLSVPVIAEGVETQDQMHALKTLGCDMVQGYFFSKPVPAKEFEAFILQKKEADLAAQKRAEEQQEREEKEQESEERILQARLQAMEEKAANDDAKKQAGEQAALEEHKGIKLRTASFIFVILGLFFAAALILASMSIKNGYQRMESASDRYVLAQHAAADLEFGSDYLTERVRNFVVTGDKQYLKDFFEEIEITRRRDKAVEDMERLLEGADSNALASLNTALALSNELVVTENRAIRLMLATGEYDAGDFPEEITRMSLSEEEAALSVDELKQKAQTMVFDNDYMRYKERIRENVNLCTQELIRSSSQKLEKATGRMALLVNIQMLLSVIFLLNVLAIVVMVSNLIRKPLTNMVRKMKVQEPIPPAGVEELQIVTRIYNHILEENRDAKERLSHEASHDALTGLFNRGAYDLLMESADKEHMALLLIDVDYFKTVNDTYGHAVGDRVLKRVAEILQHSFRSVDIICRIGGDEFAVVMTRVNSSMSQLVLNKISRANEMLQHPKDDLPPVSLSVGVAFSDRKNPKGDIFRDADTALYKVKQEGRKGCRIFE